MRKLKYVPLITVLFSSLSALNFPTEVMADVGNNFQGKTVYVCALNGNSCEAYAHVVTDSKVKVEFIKNCFTGNSIFNISSVKEGSIEWVPQGAVKAKPTCRK